MKYGLRRPRVRRLVYCQILPDDRAPHRTVRASPWRNSEGRESAGSTTDPIASAWRWRHPAATGAPFTTWRPSPTGGLSTAAAGCAGAALNRTPDTARAPGAGFGRGGRGDASATPRCAWITARPGSLLAAPTTATRLGRLGKRTWGSGRILTEILRGRAHLDRSRCHAGRPRGAPPHSTQLASRIAPRWQQASRLHARRGAALHVHAHAQPNGASCPLSARFQQTHKR